MARHTKHPLTPTECKWRRLVAEWRDGGKTAEEFAESKHINAGTLRVWSSKLKKIDADLARSGELVPPTFLPVEVVGDEETHEPEAELEPIEVHLARGDVIVVPQGCDMQQVSQIVAILRGEWQ
jgi:hypothetical protein